MEIVRNVSQIEDLVRKNFAEKNAVITSQNNIIKEKDERIAQLELILMQKKIQMEARKNIVAKMISCERQKSKYWEEKCKILESPADENKNLIAEIEEAIKKEESGEKETVTVENEKNERTNEVEQESNDVGKGAPEESFKESTLDATDYDIVDESFDQSNDCEETNSKTVLNTTRQSTDDDLIEALLDSDEEEDNDDDNKKGNICTNDFDDIKIDVNIEPTVSPKNDDQVTVLKRKYKSIDNSQESPKKKVRKVKKAGSSAKSKLSKSSEYSDEKEEGSKRHHGRGR